MGSAYDIICERRSIRRFKKKKISKEKLLKMVNAARLAPSAANIQPCEFIVVDEKELLDEVFENVKWAGYISPSGDPPKDHRPVAYIIVLIDLNKKKKGGEQDAAASIQNILLTAWEESIGSCWIGSINRKRIKRIFKIPHHLKVNSIVALGYIGEKPVIEEVKESIRYWKDDRGVLHVPKRRIEDICYFNMYMKRLGVETNAER